MSGSESDPELQDYSLISSQTPEQKNAKAQLPVQHARTAVPVRLQPQYDSFPSRPPTDIPPELRIDSLHFEASYEDSSAKGIKKEEKDVKTNKEEQRDEAATADAETSKEKEQSDGEEAGPDSAKQDAAKSEEAQVEEEKSADSAEVQTGLQTTDPPGAAQINPGDGQSNITSILGMTKMEDFCNSSTSSSQDNFLSSQSADRDSGKNTDEMRMPHDDDLQQGNNSGAGEEGTREETRSSSPVAVQRNDGGQITVSFTKQADQRQEEDEDVTHREKGKGAGLQEPDVQRGERPVSVADRIRMLEEASSEESCQEPPHQTSRHSFNAGQSHGTKNTETLKEDSQEKATPEQTAGVFCSTTSIQLDTKSPGKQEGDDEEDESIVVIQEDEVERNKDEQDKSTMADDEDDEDKFSTPRGSPTPDQDTQAKFSAQQEHVIPQIYPYAQGPQGGPQYQQQQHGYTPPQQSVGSTTPYQSWSSSASHSPVDAGGRPSPSQSGSGRPSSSQSGSGRPSSSQSGSGRPSPAHVASLRDSGSNSPAGNQQGSSPSPHMQHGDTLPGGAFRPIPQKPQQMTWPPSGMQQGSMQYPPHPQFQQYPGYPHPGPVSQPYGHPPPYQQTPPGPGMYPQRTSTPTNVYAQRATSPTGMQSQRTSTPTNMHQSMYEQSQSHAGQGGWNNMQQSYHEQSLQNDPNSHMGPQSWSSPPMPGQHLTPQQQQYWMQTQQYWQQQHLQRPQYAGQRKPSPVPPSPESAPQSFQESAGSGPDTSSFTNATIKVSGINPETDVEILELYFENVKKSGGGSIAEMNDHSDEGFVLITFKNPQVANRVLERPHKVSGQILTITLYVEEEQAPDDAKEDFSCTVQVYGGPIVLDEDMMDLYFSNKRKSGGGPITKIEMREDTVMCLITFEDPQVAQAVVSRPHTIKGTTLTAEPYTPAPQTKILVQGLSKKACDEEFLELYFEQFDVNVAEIKLDADKAEAVITFRDASSVQTVLEKKEHKIAKQPVTISLYSAPKNTTPSSSPSSKQQAQEKHSAKTTGPSPTAASSEPCCTVEVRGMNPDTTKETIEYYFENKKKSGGGSVKDVQYEEGDDVALVTFNDAETVKRVLDKSRKHKLDEHKLSLSLASSPPSQKNPSTPTASSSSADQTEVLNTVSVQGLDNMSTTEDSLLNYFENKRSGGGEVERIQPDMKAGKFYVVFCDPQAAARVADKQHKLQGQQLTVTLYRPPEMCKDRIVVRNLPEIGTAQELQLTVENKTKLDVAQILFSDEEDTAVVIFDKDIDFKQVSRALTKKQFKGSNLEVGQVPVSRTILVSNLPSEPLVTEDTLANYFENTKRSGGGDVEDVELIPDIQSALVTFAEIQVVARVVKKQHKINKQQVSVNIYMECLGLSGGRDEPTIPIPQPITLESSDFETVCLLEMIPGGLEALQTALTNLHAFLQVNKETFSATVECTLTSQTEGIRELAKTWTEKVTDELRVGLEGIYKREVSLTQEEYEEVEGLVTETFAGARDVGYRFHSQQGVLVIAHRGEQVLSTLDTLASRIKQVLNKLWRKKNEKTERVDQARGKLLLLQKRGTLQGTQEKYPELKINIQPDEGFVELTGLAEEIQDAKLDLMQLFLNVHVSAYTWDSQIQKELMSKEEAKGILYSKSTDVCAADDILEITSEGLTVCSLTPEQAELVQATLLRSINKRVIHYDENALVAVKGMAWEEQKTKVMQGNEETMQMYEDEDNKSLTILSVHGKNLQQAYNSLKEFLNEKCEREHEFPLPKVLHALFKPYLQEKVNSLQLSFEDFNLDEFNDKVTVRGNALQINAAQTIYRGFREALAQETKTFKQPSMEEFFKKPEWNKKRTEIEHDHRCLVLEPGELPDDFMSWEGASLLGAVGGQEAYPHIAPIPDRQFGLDDDDFSSYSRPSLPSALTTSHHFRTPRASGRSSKAKKGANVEVPASSTPVAELRPKLANLPVRPRLYLSIMSDITKEEHHVLVNSASTNLNMGQGQVAQALLKVGGDVIQQELKTNYPNGIKLGEVAVSTGGKLMCKKLFHCCLPTEQDEKKIDEVVQGSVMRCMAEAEKLQMGSIGFPSLGTGNLGYPAKVVARSMFEAALDYGRKNPNSVISDVFFILHQKDDQLQKVFREEENLYKQALKDSRKPEPEQEEESYIPPTNPDAQGVQTFPYFQETVGNVTKVIIGIGEDAVRRAANDIVACYKSLVGSYREDVPMLEQWETLHIETMKQNCRILCVDITFNFSLGWMELNGFKESMSRISIHSIIKDADEQAHNVQRAQLLVKQVQWSYVEVAEDGEHLVPYPPMSNLNIEDAYLNGDHKAVTVDADRKAFFIDFAKMEEFPEDPSSDQDSVRVIRQNKIATLDVQPPNTWTAMGNNDMDVVPVQAGTPEYNAVHEKFVASLNNPSCQIVKIERVQNLTLYKQYSMMKQQMQSRMDNNRICEKTDLWHGTKEEAVDGIMKYGFNRSYSDQKKSAYGQGAYFAATAEYSSRNEYAVANPITKQRNMFQCSVLVGFYTVGKADMRTPPEVTTGTGKRYDSTVDDTKKPSIYVTYSDVQAYPEYRIVFSDS